MFYNAECPQELFQKALLVDTPPSLRSRGFFIWQSWTSALGNAVKLMLQSTEVVYFNLMLFWRWMKTEVIIKQNEKAHMAFGTTLILEVVSNRSRADIPPLLSLQPALKPLRPAGRCVWLRQSKASSHSCRSWNRAVCSSLCLSLWAVTVMALLPARLGGTWMAMLI